MASQGAFQAEPATVWHIGSAAACPNTRTAFLTMAVVSKGQRAKCSQTSNGDRGEANTAVPPAISLGRQRDVRIMGALVLESKTSSDSQNKRQGTSIIHPSTPPPTSPCHSHFYIILLTPPKKEPRTIRDVETARSLGSFFKREDKDD